MQVGATGTRLRVTNWFLCCNRPSVRPSLPSPRVRASPGCPGLVPGCLREQTRPRMRGAGLGYRYGCRADSSASARSDSQRASPSPRESADRDGVRLLGAALHLVSRQAASRQSRARGDHRVLERSGGRETRLGVDAEPGAQRDRLLVPSGSRTEPTPTGGTGTRAYAAAIAGGARASRGARRARATRWRTRARGEPALWVGSSTARSAVAAREGSRLHGARDSHPRWQGSQGSRGAASHLARGIH